MIHMLIQDSFRINREDTRSPVMEKIEGTLVEKSGDGVIHKQKWSGTFVSIDYLSKKCPVL